MSAVASGGYWALEAGSLASMIAHVRAGVRPHAILVEPALLADGGEEMLRSGLGGVLGDDVPPIVARPHRWKRHELLRILPRVR